jgi:hypothetical protein
MKLAAISQVRVEEAQLPTMETMEDGFGVL